MLYDFPTAVRRFYNNYANFEGRAVRSEYWWVQLFQLAIFTGLVVMLMIAVGGFEALEDESELAKMGLFGWLPLLGIVIFALANFIPNLALAVRRLHDLGQSGWLHLGFILGGFIPVIGFFISLGELIWFMMPGTSGANAYGPDPLTDDVGQFD